MAASCRPTFWRKTAGLHVIAADQPGQAWFFIGYPMAFLARLFRATGELQYLATARGYFDFTQHCAAYMVDEHFAHKVAWGAAELACATGNPDHLGLRHVDRRAIDRGASRERYLDERPADAYAD